ncbi:plasmid partitioning protein RepB [Brucella sp. 21LCYQ03]|nr:plasmid partitioning protein RepB [Brucella sp. 21LCYQ03]
MSRKNLLSSLTDAKKLTAVNSTENEQPAAPSDNKLTAVNSPQLPPAQVRNRSRGAFGAITRSIDELAEKAKAADEIHAQMLQGSAVIEIDAGLIDVSFVEDRMEQDGAALDELIQAIEERGQDSPILVRPHPERAGRYMVVFGHRRLRAAKALSRPVRAVVKELSNREHVIAQGQENSARSNLSFIEKAVFASNLIAQGYDRDVLTSALGVDKTVVSKMLSVIDDIPTEVIHAIGAAKNTGRDTWYKVAQKLRMENNRAAALNLINDDAFKSADSDQRLELLTTQLADQKAETAPAKTGQVKHWESDDRALSLTVKRTRSASTISISKANSQQFAEWIGDNMDELYSSFIRSRGE